MVCLITHCKRQRAQNAMVRRICHVRLFDHFTPFFSGLHWLLVRNKIQIETFLLTYKASKILAPTFITELCSWIPSEVFE